MVSGTDDAVECSADRHRGQAQGTVTVSAVVVIASRPFVPRSVAETGFPTASYLYSYDAPSGNGDLTYYASLYLVRVTAPRGTTIVASGVEVGREVDRRTQVLTLAAGPARWASRSGSTIRMPRSRAAGPCAPQVGRRARGGTPVVL